jgi:hypothetical protein
MVAKKGRQAITDSNVGDGEKCCESLASVLGATTPSSVMPITAYSYRMKYWAKRTRTKRAGK